ncbi:Ubiquitin-conjugating enzyme E2 27 [Tetrabaena socialis]|uniref:Ubiquitin-conjugating enzyme E2 27 n=1 Tax=Tetrabaena socialis TaxID=47790 RepID=A0A2J7ZVQ1_9CHLO|nr:Ubiquitin-conjugating enzyme E2 27 [Tetrabaena socialis]|eukprot:PNH04318.1 Ubiquitin-conjugating enzyme E2 27 [Tetrabaena socialis]
MALDLGRIQKELKEIDRDKASGVTVQLRNNSLQHLLGFVPGPKDTPYEGGLFAVDIVLENAYPFVPPKMKFGGGRATGCGGGVEVAACVAWRQLAGAPCLLAVAERGSLGGPDMEGE